MLRFVMTVAFLALIANSAVAADLLTYEAPGWKYKQVQWNDPLSETFYAISFDDADWGISQAAFGNFGELNAPPPFCAAVYTVHTQWDLSTDLLLRRYFLAGMTDPVRIYLSIDNDATVYVNGVEVFTTTHEGCPLPDDFVIGVPIALLSPTGVNLLAVRASDRGWFCFVDVQITGDYPPVAVEGSTWGAVKALYR